MRNQRPSEVLAVTMHALGASKTGGWLESSLPPLVGEAHSEVGRTLVLLAACVVAVMLIKPFLNASEDDWPVYLQAQGLVGSRAAATVWVLLMFAAQVAPMAWVSQIQRLAMLISVIALVLGLAYAAARSFRRSSRHDEDHSWLVNVGLVVMMTGFALVLAIIGPALSLAFWFFATESDTFSKIKLKSIQDRPRPTGARELS